MTTAAYVATVIVALLHLGFMYMETAGWPGMARSFGYSSEQVETTRVLAANQGIYNGALAATLLWALLSGNTQAVTALLVFVVLVGLFGAWTASPRILVVQVLPAAIALILTWAATR